MFLIKLNRKSFSNVLKIRIELIVGKNLKCFVSESIFNKSYTNFEGNRV